MEGEEARVVGGAVRNTLFGLAVSDVDIATTCLPQETMDRALALGFTTVPTGIKHGTITVVARSHVFEVTTLRTDTQTDGRHAMVQFGHDWQADAARRDFTMNALYADAQGKVYDDVDGLKDIASRTIRFIGKAEERIREDYLRILRFYRFFAWYGEGRPDAQGLKATAKLKDGLAQLSVERIWAELKKLLSAPDPARALLWMRQTGVLTAILPESEKWGIDAIPALLAAEKVFGWLPDPLLRLQAIVPPTVRRMRELGQRLKLSNAEKKRLVHWAQSEPVSPDSDALSLRQRLYRENPAAVCDRLRHGIAAAHTRGGDEKGARVLDRLCCDWQPPSFPLKGADISARGYQGAEIGAILKKLEALWVESGFTMKKAALLATLKK